MLNPDGGQMTYHQGRMPQPALPLATLALGFVICILVVSTIRAALNPDGAEIISDKRILATALGGLIYWFTIREISRYTMKSLNEIIVKTLYISVAGIVALLALRSVVDAVTLNDTSESLARNIRWMLLWIGYFAAWVAGFAALLLYRQMRSFTDEAATGSALREEGRAAAAPLTAIGDRAPQTTSDTLEWITDAIAAEIVRDPQVDRTTLMANLLQRSGYESTDVALAPESAQKTARKALIGKIGARITS